ncbi:hypothetical protein JCM10296v2_006499 [Rhodotorula toruloides]
MDANWTPEGIGRDAQRHNLISSSTPTSTFNPRKMPVTPIKSESQYKDAQAITPRFKAYAENPRWKDFKFYRVDICDQQDVAMTSGVEMAPTFHFYKNGAKVKEFVGSSYPALERTMGAVLAGH